MKDLISFCIFGALVGSLGSRGESVKHVVPRIYIVLRSETAAWFVQVT